MGKIFNHLANWQDYLNCNFNPWLVQMFLDGSSGLNGFFVQILEP